MLVPLVHNILGSLRPVLRCGSGCHAHALSRYSPPCWSSYRVARQSDAETSMATPLTPTNAEEMAALLETSTRPVVINVWASWCIPCRSEAPLHRTCLQPVRQTKSGSSASMSPTPRAAPRNSSPSSASRSRTSSMRPDRSGGAGRLRSPADLLLRSRRRVGSLPAGGDRRADPGVADRRVTQAPGGLLVEFTLLWAAATGVGLAVLHGQMGRTVGPHPQGNRKSERPDSGSGGGRSHLGPARSHVPVRHQPVHPSRRPAHRAQRRRHRALRRWER